MSEPAQEWNRGQQPDLPQSSLEEKPPSRLYDTQFTNWETGPIFQEGDCTGVQGPEP